MVVGRGVLLSTGRPLRAAASLVIVKFILEFFLVLFCFIFHLSVFILLISDSFDLSLGSVLLKGKA